MRIHIGIAVVVFVLAAWLKVDRVGWALLFVAVGGVIAAELLNTAVETVVDMVSPRRHPLAKRAKDAAAGAVLVQSVVATVLCYVVFSTRVSPGLALLPFVGWTTMILIGFRAHKEEKGHDDDAE